VALPDGSCAFPDADEDAADRSVPMRSPAPCAALAIDRKRWSEKRLTQI
jgi:hypothetical protein